MSIFILFVTGILSNSAFSLWIPLKILLFSHLIRICKLVFSGLNFSIKYIQKFNPIQDGLFRGCSRMGGPFWPPPPPNSKICRTYPTMMELGTVIPYLRKIQKMYKSCDPFLEFCWHQNFFTGINKFCYIKKYTYWLDFDT